MFPCGCTEGPPGADGASPDVQFFDADGTWTKPSGTYTLVQIDLVGGGGGGGSGRRGAAGSGRGGGAGGGTGGYDHVLVPFASIPSSLAIIIGTGGPGAAAVTVNDTDGSPGTSGTNTTVIGTGISLVAGGGRRGSGGTAATSSTPNTSGQTVTYAVLTANNGNSQTTGGSSKAPIDFSAGGGGGITSGDVASNGNASSAGCWYATPQPSGGLVDGAIPVSPTNPIAGAYGVNGGGSGGAASITTHAQAGSNGAKYGGGGGGGGASLNAVGNSGAGGAGANGAVRIICW